VKGVAIRQLLLGKARLRSVARWILKQVQMTVGLETVFANYTIAKQDRGLTAQDHFLHAGGLP